MYHPSRGGVRGGADQFEWDSVKTDKHRENYLGHSLMAPVGRWQKKKDLQWFSREKKDSANSRDEEKEAIRRMEAEAMAAALGKGPVKRAPTQLTKQELDEVCRKGQTERDDTNIERIEGMGFGSTRASLMSSADTKETMSALGCQVSKAGSSKQNNDAESPNADSKESKRDRKKEKKEKRKHKKKKSKSSKRSKRHDSDSDSDDQDRKLNTDRPNTTQSTKHRSKRTRHDPTMDSESDSRNIRKTERNAVSKRRQDSTPDDKPHSRKNQLIDCRSKNIGYSSQRRHVSSDDEEKHGRHKRKETTRRRRHDSYSD